MSAFRKITQKVVSFSEFCPAVKTKRPRQKECHRVVDTSRFKKVGLISYSLIERKVIIFIVNYISGPNNYLKIVVVQ